MKLTQKDFDKLVNSRVEEELRKTRGNRHIMTMWIASFVISVIILWGVSLLGGVLFFAVTFGIGLLWARRNFKNTAAKIRPAMLQEWKGSIEG